MGLKIKAGMAIAGIAMSWFCGIPFLSGIASHLDTTGNVMVDIADGIGLISKVTIFFTSQTISLFSCPFKYMKFGIIFDAFFKGIEALENYLDPPKPTEGGDENPVDGIHPSSNAPPQAEQPPPQQIVWRKGKNGKDIHYDPAKDKVCNFFQAL